MIWLTLFIVLTVLVITNRIASQTYVAKVLLYFDVFVGSLFARGEDISISSYCGIALRTPNSDVFLRGLGHLLNVLQPNHCNLAIQHDIERAKAALAILGS